MKTKEQASVLRVSTADTDKDAHCLGAAVQTCKDRGRE
jgi:hypothetical protein